MDERIFQYLKSDDPDDRIKAVKALAQVKDDESKRAISILARLYHQDASPNVRQWAFKAGRHLKKQLRAAEWLGDDEIVYVDVPESDRRDSRRLMNQALQATFTGEMREAEKAVRRAFQMNPNLQHDGEMRRIAADVFNMREDDVIAELLGDEG
mgnify:CR=1 FL=1